MFWKRKKTEPFDVEPAEGASERRNAFRIGVEPDNPVMLGIDGREFRVTNISAGGLAFKGKGFAIGQTHTVRLQLPDGVPIIHTQVEIVRIGGRSMCRCRFLQLSTLSRDALHRYILGREKHQIRATRRRSALIGYD